MLRLDYLQNLSESSQAALLSATRGPDTDSSYDLALKLVFTSRIRAIVATSWEGNYISEPLQIFEFKELKKRKDATSSRHYRRHLCEAILSSRGHPIWSGLEVQAIDKMREPDWE